MGKRGPLPKPTARKRFEGNPGKRPLPEDEPTPEALEKIPPPPAWLDKRAAACWRVVARELHGIGMLHRIDLQMLEAYSVTYSNWRAMVEATSAAGFVARYYSDHGAEKYAQPTPEATLAAKYADQLNRLAKVLGIGPAHRVGLSRAGAGGDGEDGTPKHENPVLALIHGDTSPPPKRKGSAG